jgi:hypothetical protein
VTTAFLQVKKDCRQFRCGGGPSLAAPAYFVVLTKHATEIAVREEDGSRSAGAAEASFFTEMRTVATYNGVAAGAANGGFVVQSVRTASSGTQFAVGEHGDGAFDPGAQFTVLPQLKVRRSKQTVIPRMFPQCHRTRVRPKRF